MSDTVIRVENLGKRYIIGHQQQERYTALRDVLANKAKGITKIFNPKSKPQNPNLEEFWALKDVSFEVKRGDRIGIIGRNGAGKSTLLKILSRITEPTEGRITIRGRVASLLEVGTGFHPELTGRENIYLNGAILGMSKVEIRRKFDEIVAFAEVEKFLDTPVKRYSSGMYVRLAFAVAAHLEPEILIVDEVLAVGDAQFQKKCLGKMEDVAEKDGRTVLFVSHNMGAIEQLCDKAVFLEHGHLKEIGKNIKKIIGEYSNIDKSQGAHTEWVNVNTQHKNVHFTPRVLKLVNNRGENINVSVNKKDLLSVLIEGNIHEPNPLLTIGYALYYEDELLYWSYPSDEAINAYQKTVSGHFSQISQIPLLILNSGQYRIEMIGGLHGKKWILEPGKDVPKVFFTLDGKPSNSPYWNSRRPGIIAPLLSWSVTYNSLN